MNNDNGNNFDNEFTYLFNGQCIDGWRMAGPGKFVFIEYDKSVQSEGGMGFAMVCRKEIQGFCIED
jgi:hypothetical protein